MSYTVRRIGNTDIARYLTLTQYIDRETDFLGVSPNDPRPPFMQVIGAIKSEYQIVFVAEEGGQLIGHLGAFWRRGKGERLRHCMTLGLGVLQAHWGKGVGAALMEAFEKWAAANGIKRIELEVMVHNKAAIALYNKRGFVTEGTKKCSILIGDEYIDELMMAKLL